MCSVLLCLEEVTDDSSSTRVELSNGVDNQTRDTLERCMATGGKVAEKEPKMLSRARKEASAQKSTRMPTSSLLERNALEWKHWSDNAVFDLVDLRKF